MYEIYRDAPGRYTTTTFDKNNENNEEFSNNLFESEHETSPQNLPEPLPKNNFEPLQARRPICNTHRTCMNTKITPH